MRVVLHLDHDREVPDQLLVRNHSRPTSIAAIHTIRTWLDASPMPDFFNYMFGPHPTLHTPPAYHPIGNPPTQMPAAPQNMVASILEWEIPTTTPPLRPVNTRRATPYPATTNANPAQACCDPSTLALPWYGVGGVPERVDAPEDEQVAAEALAAFSLEAPSVFSAGGSLKKNT